MPRPLHSAKPLDAATRYTNTGIPLLPYQLPSQPHQPSDAPCPTCRRLDCPAPPLHPSSPLHQQGQEQQAPSVTRWWTTDPHSAIATLTGSAFDAIEIHTTIPPDTVLAWVHDQDPPIGPVLHAGHSRLQFLTKPASYQPDRYDSATAAILYLAPGTLILLPPSQLPGGQPVTWLRPLHDLDHLPDGTDLFWALTDLPANRQLPDPNTYAFHSSHHEQHNNSLW
jgi:hypothetical protein